MLIYFIKYIVLIYFVKYITYKPILRFYIKLLLIYLSVCDGDQCPHRHPNEGTVAPRDSVSGGCGPPAPRHGAAASQEARRSPNRWPSPRSLPPQPVPEELQGGGGFGYVVMLRPVGAAAWTTRRVPAVESCRFVYRNESVSPLSPFEVKVGVYNSEGDGALSAAAVVYSGEDGKSRPRPPGPRALGPRSRPRPRAVNLSAKHGCVSSPGGRAPAGPAGNVGPELLCFGDGGVVVGHRLEQEHRAGAGLRGEPRGHLPSTRPGAPVSSPGSGTASLLLRTQQLPGGWGAGGQLMLPDSHLSRVSGSLLCEPEQACKDSLWRRQ